MDDYFGEIAALTGGQRFMSIKAVTYCHLYSLQQKLLEVTHPQHAPNHELFPPSRPCLSHQLLLPRYTAYR